VALVAAVVALIFGFLALDDDRGLETIGRDDESPPTSTIDQGNEAPFAIIAGTRDADDPVWLDEAERVVSTMAFGDIPRTRFW